MWKEKPSEDRKNIMKSFIRPRKDGTVDLIILRPVPQTVMLLGNVSMLRLTHFAEMGRSF